MGKNRNGHNADDIILKVPFGTEILNEDKNVKLADLVDKDDNIILAKGGIGGKGNAFLKALQINHQDMPNLEKKVKKKQFG